MLIVEAIQIKISSKNKDKESKADLQLVVITYCGEKINNKNAKIIQKIKFLLSIKNEQSLRKKNEKTAEPAVFIFIL